MKENFFTSMLSEGGKISHKRWISVTVAATLVWVIVYATLKANNASERLSIIIATMCFVAVLVGVATLPQIVSLFRGTPLPKDDETKKTE